MTRPPQKEVLIAPDGVPIPCWQPRPNCWFACSAWTWEQALAAIESRRWVRPAGELTAEGDQS